MMITTFMITFIILILNGLYMVVLLFNTHKFHDREKNSPFECGFDPFSTSRISFSVHFFSIMLMFLIFDVEISVLIPMPLTLSFTYFNIWGLSAILLIFILILGLGLEWKEGSMNWK
uniref:NADH-ubiquinone oxidoreductase chain 3 n=1 Tax=Anoeconeossa unicornuta TaxID=2218011 RepID=A0A344A246_9HEMI|nr:NADH dehydrogenase subunit 3 [Anoeconeossa unicornuta]AWU48837.1 NADH dehydrogenase subunit 3 [Anoeconeossa unicornuta]